MNLKLNTPCSQCYALKCTKLPSLSRKDFVVHRDNTFSVPIVHLTVSSISCFPLLHAWITCPSVSNLMCNLLPGASQNASSELVSLVLRAQTSHRACFELTAHLAATSTSGQLMEHINLLHGLRENTIGLGMADGQLWYTMALTNSLLCSALKRQQVERSSLA